MQKIIIKDIEVYAKHGVFEEEKRNGQIFLVSVELECDQQAIDDKLDTTIDYSVVCKDVHRYMQAHTFNLIETAAEGLCALLLQKYTLAIKAQVRIKKPQVDLGVKIEYVAVEQMRQRQMVYIGLGSNLGNRNHYIQSALNRFKKEASCQIIQTSSIIETAPYGKTDQPHFLNCVVQLSTFLKPLELLTLLQSIEAEAGRERKERWAARTLDADILFYGNQIFSNQNLTVPHPDLHNRLFVLDGLCELSPFFIHPVLRNTVGTLFAALKDKR